MLGKVRVGPSGLPTRVHEFIFKKNKIKIEFARLGSERVEPNFFGPKKKLDHFTQVKPSPSLKFRLTSRLDSACVDIPTQIGQEIAPIQLNFGLGWIWGPNGVNEIRANGMKLNFFFLISIFVFLFFQYLVHNIHF